MKRALLILAVAFTALQAAPPANAYWGGGPGGSGYGYGGGPANFVGIHNGGMGYGGPGMFGGNRFAQYGNPGFGYYRHCRRHHRWW